MKKIAISLFVLAISYAVNAQIETPAPSPFSKLEQKVGLTDITVEYSRPGVKGRKIFGDLEEYGKIWRTGANQNTKITFNTDVTVDGQPLKKGTYALYTKPRENTWEILFYTDSNNWGTPKVWDENKVALKTVVTPQEMSMLVETFTISIDDITNNNAVIGLLWENTYVPIPFAVPTEKMVVANIEKKMAGPSAGDYYASAVYFLEADKDIKQAQIWIDKAIEMTSNKPLFYYLRQQSLIHAKAGNKKGAIAAAKESIKYAKIANNDAYVKMNQVSLKEWGEM